VGEYNLPNILCAVTIGKHFGVPDYKIIEAIESYAPSNSRSQLIERGNNKVILDAYNANPSSMKVTIENFAKLKADRKIVMLGGMMELGEDSIDEHLALVQQLIELGFKEVVLVGGDFVHTKELFPNKEKAHYTFLPNSTDASEWLKELNPQHSYILVKGSRSINMENVLTN
jgi:UDP-N-acetylmuramoyl-tripeptide--D-alanyl-D-alanine ligase